MRIASWNLYNFDGAPGARQARADVLRDLESDVVLVQELRVPAHRAHAELAALADEAGMTAWTQPPRLLDDGTEPGHAAVAVADTGYHVGIMWNPDTFTPVELTTAGRELGLWHAAALLRLRTRTDTEFDVISTHADPFDPARRISEAHQLIRLAEKRARTGSGLVFTGGDWNAIARDPHADPDPYPGKWSPALVHQVLLTVDDRGHPRRWQADRRPDELLGAAGFADPAAAEHPAPVTTGHCADDPYPPRRLDRILCTALAANLVSSHQVHPAGAAISDHLPVSVDLNP